MGRKLTGRTGTFTHVERYEPLDKCVEYVKNIKKINNKRNNSIVVDRFIENYDEVLLNQSNDSNISADKSFRKRDVDYYNGMKVVHLQFGSGLVVGLTATKVKIKFDDRARGIKIFDRKTVYKGNIVIPLKTVMKKVSLRNFK